MLGMPRVILYSRPNCCLCADARREFALAMPDVQLEEIDVDSDPELQVRYGDDIPVAVVNGHVLFRHRFDPDSVRNLLGADLPGARTQQA